MLIMPYDFCIIWHYFEVPLLRKGTYDVSLVLCHCYAIAVLLNNVKIMVAYTGSCHIDIMGEARSKKGFESDIDDLRC